MERGVMSAVSEQAAEATVHPGSALEVLRVFTRLGLTSFGGPIAHLGFFRTEFVEHRRWLDETHYADVVALSQFLPGPASSKVGIIIGVSRAGIPGALAAWVGFTMPSALALILFGYGVAAFGHLWRRRLAPRLENRGGRRRGPGGVGNGAKPLPRSGTRDYSSRRRRAGSGSAFHHRSGRSHRGGRAYRLVVSAGRDHSVDPAAGAHQPVVVYWLDHPVLRAADRAAATHGRNRKPWRCPVRRLLSVWI